MLFTTRHSAIRMLAIVGIIAIGALTGCSENTPTPSLPTSVEEVEQEAKDLAREAAELGNKAADELNKIVNGDLPIQEQFDKLAAESKELYCGAKAHGAEAIDAVKRAAQAAWDELVRDNPDVEAPKLDLDGTACE